MFGGLSVLELCAYHLIIHGHVVRSCYGEVMTREITIPIVGLHNDLLRAKETCSGNCSEILSFRDLTKYVLPTSVIIHLLVVTSVYLRLRHHNDSSALTPRPLLLLLDLHGDSLLLLPSPRWT